MQQFPRYAIYYVPESDTALGRFGARMLGYDAHSGEPVAHPEETLAKFSDWPALTQEPRRYGFHATLKAPFSLVAGTDESKLVDAFHDFARTPCEIPVIEPVVGLMGDFIALVPAASPPALSRLADDCVGRFERFRAPLTPQDRARRLKAPLTSRQIAHLDRWGYPHVFEDFRFHMTLTGRLPDGKRADVLDYLQTSFATLAISSLPLSTLAIFRQPAADERFEVMTRATLKHS